MTTNEALIICAGAVDRFGERHQVLKAVEELGELAVALTRYLEDDVARDCPEAQVCEEIADVEIMVAQLRMIFDAEAVERVKEEKLRALSLKTIGWRDSGLQALAERLKREEARRELRAARLGGPARAARDARAACGENACRVES